MYLLLVETGIKLNWVLVDHFVKISTSSQSRTTCVILLEYILSLASKHRSIHELSQNIHNLSVDGPLHHL